MNLERAEVAAERLVLVAGNFLIAKEQHLMLDERGPHLVERALAEFSKMNPANLSAQRAGDGTYRYVLKILHRNFLQGQHTRRRPIAPLPCATPLARQQTTS